MVSSSDSFTFLLKLFLLLNLSAFLCAQKPKPSIETDKSSLLEFKSRLNQNSLEILSSWNDSIPICEWIGVKCSLKHQRVHSLNLAAQKLAGVISPHLGNLSFLRALSLASNSFRSEIPHEIGKLSRLRYLNISYNFLQDSIPISIANCSHLKILDLASNDLARQIPSELGGLSSLVYLSLGTNSLSGMFPSSFGNLTSLEQLDVVFNQLEGEIPDTIDRMKNISYFLIASNKFSGVFPSKFYNLSSLEVLSLTNNRFSGSLNPDFGDVLPNLLGLYLGDNYFSGTIPVSISNITSLLELNIGGNNITGNVPIEFGKLQNLQFLSVAENLLGHYAVNDLDFLNELSNCSQLEVLGLHDNHFGGNLMNKVSNLSSQLTILALGRNFITGNIPSQITDLVSLTALGLEHNLLTGNIPDSIGKLINMKKLILHSNKLTGLIPSSLGNITQLLYLVLSFNALEGTIPPTLGNCSYLLNLYLGNNKLNGTLPSQVIGIASLLDLRVSSNALSGPLPQDIGNLKNLYSLNVSYNNLYGEIPGTLGKCVEMKYLSMQSNVFEGNVPDFSGMKSIKFLDLSKNNLSGHIPKYMTSLDLLENLNLSFNKFEHEVPTQGIFRNESSVEVYGNSKLCGGIQELHLQPCSNQKSRKHVPLVKFIVATVIVTLLVLFLVFFASLYWWRKQRRIKNPISRSSFEPFFPKISYKELHDATEGFSTNNLIGSGHFGSVYKACLGPENSTVAVKVLKLQQHGASKSFVSECEALKNVKHRNLVKIITACSSTDFQRNDFKALVYEFMSNGSLESWVHFEERTREGLKLLQRMNIAIDVATALVYLHDSCENSIVHCDLKPSNVLLNDDLTAHVSDFGLARLLSVSGQESVGNRLSSAGIKGTLGYAAPEYGLGGQPSAMGDVFSFGILLLEMFTGKRPTNEVFIDDMNLHSYVKSALPAQVLEVIDMSVFDAETINTENFQARNANSIEGLMLTLQIGVHCSETSVADRMEMTNALKELVNIRRRMF